MSYVGESNPNWLSSKFINDTFDWSKSIKSDFITFFNFVTLHDSYWIGLNLDNYGELNLAIKLDGYWNKEFSESNEKDSDWPYLIIRIPNAINISFNAADQDMIISQTESECLSKSEIEKIKGILSESKLLPAEFYGRLIKCEEVHKTKFIDLGGANVEILHDKGIQILLLDQEGNYIDTSLEKLKPFIEAHKQKEKGFIKGIWDKLTEE